MFQKNTSIDQWDKYWNEDKLASGSLYHFIANIYRNLIFINALGHFVNKYVNKNAMALHAGCGSGDVDQSINKQFCIIALDFSIKAINLYNNTNGKYANAVQGNILYLPFDTATFDCVYNLGVMEHFTEDQIDIILSEFNRVLKPGGRLLIFWPPEFGLSVRFFKVISVIGKRLQLLNEILRYPQEITRIQSKSHAIAIFQKANFKVIECYFGIHDMFTHCVIIAEK